MQSVELTDTTELVDTGRWATFDTTSFPLVRVKMTGVIQDQDDFNRFIEGWRNLYSRNERFSLEFDTSEVGNVSMKYAFQMRSFIRELKSSHPRLLERSTISVSSRWVRFLLKIIFFFEKPVADVYIENIKDGSVQVVTAFS